jgi:hypothetical protein
MADAFKLPLLKISILKDKKGPGHLFRFCHLVALEAFFTFYPQSKNRLMTSSKNQPFSCQLTMVSGNCTPSTGGQGIQIDLQGTRTVEPMALPARDDSLDITSLVSVSGFI